MLLALHSSQPAGSCRDSRTATIIYTVSVLMGPQLGQIGHGMFTRPLQCDDGRDVHLVDVYEEGSKVSLAVKAWTVERFGCNTAQVSRYALASDLAVVWSTSQWHVVPSAVGQPTKAGCIIPMC